jgi:osmotically inducible protein OsmC
MSALYKTQVKVTGGREGKVQSTDGKFETLLTPPKELGGPANGTGTNPEQLFAAGYGACFESAVRFVARQKKINLTQASVLAEVSLYKREEGGFKLGVELNVSLPEVDKATAEQIAHEAHTQICPYSHATRGNVEVTVRVV